MIINTDNMKIEEVNSYYHKVRGIVFDQEGKMYLASMNGTYTLPGGGVEKNETIWEAMMRELKEELGIVIAKEELSYIGNYKFYHKDFPDFNGNRNRLNEIDLFWINQLHVYKPKESSITSLEQEQNLKIIAIDINEMDELLNVPNDNPFKKALDEELKIFIDIIKERK